MSSALPRAVEKPRKLGRTCLDGSRIHVDCIRIGLGVATKNNGGRTNLVSGTMHCESGRIRRQDGGIHLRVASGAKGANNTIHKSNMEGPDRLSAGV